MNPAAAAAQPEELLSIDTTTGMSAPPMPMTRWRPISPATPVIASSQINALASSVTNITPKTTQAITIARLSACRAGSISGLPEMLPRSLPNAMIEPVKVIEPMNTSRKISISWISLSVPAKGASGAMKLESPTRTAARPTKLCRTATSSGIEVIATRAAR